MKFLEKLPFFGKKQSPAENLQPASPAPGSPEAKQATANILAQNLANLENNAAMAKESGVASTDASTISALEQKIAEGGVTPTVNPDVKKAEFSTPPPLPVTFGQVEGPKPSAATVESLTAEVTKLAQADAESEATASIPPKPVSTLDKAA